MLSVDKNLNIILLPGLDGTGLLFEPFLKKRPDGILPKVISYPEKEVFSYEALENKVWSMLPDDESFFMLGESFSGPIALNLAARMPRNLKGVILSASFVESPVPGWLKLLPLNLMTRLSPPSAVIQYVLLNGAVNPEIIRLVKKAAGSVTPDVISGRVRSVLKVNVSKALQQIKVPILYLGGLKDRLVNGGSCRLIKKIRPDVEVVEIDGPHLLLQIEPEAAWKAIEDFMDSTTGSPIYHKKGS